MKIFRLTEAQFNLYSSIRLLGYSFICLWLAFKADPIKKVETVAFVPEETEPLVEVESHEPLLAQASIYPVQSAPEPSLVKAGMTPPARLQEAPAHVRQFIKRWLPVAADMAERYDVPISSQLAQSAKETGWGIKGSLVGNANNYFGIKCKDKKHNHSKCVSHADAHWVKYKTPWESWKHHAQFLNGNRYKHCLKKKSVTSYNLCIAEAGYCHPPDGYGQDINVIIATYDLDAFDGLTPSEAKKVAKKIN